MTKLLTLVFLIFASLKIASAQDLVQRKHSSKSEKVNSVVSQPLVYKPILDSLSVLNKEHKDIILKLKEQEKWKYFAPFAAACLTALITILGNFLLKNKELKEKRLSDQKAYFFGLVSDFVTECYMASSHRESARQMKQSNPDLSTVELFEKYFVMNKKAYLLLNQIKVALNPSLIPVHKKLSDNLEIYFREAVLIRPSSDKEERAEQNRRIVNLSDAIIEAARKIVAS